MTLGLLEAAVDALEDYFSKNISTKLDEVQARYEDTYTLEDVVKWYLGALPTSWPLQPSICIKGDAENISDPTRLCPLDLNIIVMIEHVEPEVRFRKLCRYAIAVVELLQEGEATYGYIHEFKASITLSDVLTGNSQWLQAISIPVRLSKQETF